jgi:micrococcal nuclease
MKTPQGTVTTARERRARLWRSLGALGVVVSAVLVGQSGPSSNPQGPAPTPLPSSMSCRAVEVHDGDTFTCTSAQVSFPVRVTTIDAPELDQRYGPGARQVAQSLLVGKTVTLTSLSRDRYGRVLATVTLPDSTDLAQVLAFKGLAWWYAEYAPGASAIQAAELAASTAHRGLWADTAPLAPWLWRHRGSPSPSPSPVPSPPP